jgi:hypothetical protein
MSDVAQQCEHALVHHHALVVSICILSTSLLRDSDIV